MPPLNTRWDANAVREQQPEQPGHPEVLFQTTRSRTGRGRLRERERARCAGSQKAAGQTICRAFVARRMGPSSSRATARRVGCIQPGAKLKSSPTWPFGGGWLRRLSIRSGVDAAGPRLRSAWIISPLVASCSRHLPGRGPLQHDLHRAGLDGAADAIGQQHHLAGTWSDSPEQLAA